MTTRIGDASIRKNLGTDAAETTHRYLGDPEEYDVAPGLIRRARIPMRALGSVLVWLGLVAGLPSAIYAMTMVQDHEGSSTLPHDAAKCSACSLAPPGVNPAQPLLIPDETVAYVEDASDGELIP